eukprot:1361700-Amphidinium_carterae.1
MSVPCAKVCCCSQELSRMAEDLYSRCSANNIEAETVERLCSVEAHASALRKQVAELTAQLEEMSTDGLS